MSIINDNLLVNKILSLLVTPFDQSNAYKLGIIDANGVQLKPLNTLSDIELNSYNYLTKLVFTVKKLLALLPDGISPFNSMVAAYTVIKENLNSDIQYNDLQNAVLKLENNKTITQEEIELFKYISLFEDGEGSGAAAPVGSSTGSSSGNVSATDNTPHFGVGLTPTNVTGANVATDKPVVHPKNKLTKPKVLKRNAFSEINQ